jgi:hypothetical protein
MILTFELSNGKLESFHEDSFELAGVIVKLMLSYNAKLISFNML